MGSEMCIRDSQKHSAEDDIALINSMIPYFKDERYIKEDGKPVLLVYRVDLFPDMKATAERWRKIAKDAGFTDLHLCAVQFYGIDDPRPWGFDAAVEFPPHKFLGPENRCNAHLNFKNPNFQGGISDYRKIVAQSLSRSSQEYTWYRGIIPSWDNTARRQNTPHIIHDSSPKLYQFWLSELAKRAEAHKSPYIFINAWNEWGEGCHLEPDLKHGHQFLEATYAGLHGAIPSPDTQVYEEFSSTTLGPAFTDGIYSFRKLVGLAQENRLLIANGYINPHSGTALGKKILRALLRPAKPILKKMFRKLKSALSDP